MVERFKTRVHDELRRRARPTGLTTRQVVTLASLVEKETARAEERPLVAAVYRNRLAIGMGMQADPTVVYALRKRGEVRRQHPPRRSGVRFAVQHLPVSRACRPVRSPRRAGPRSRRRWRPPTSKYLYFVSRNDGSHVFAETLREHNANVQKFQVEYFRSAGRVGGRR